MKRRFSLSTYLIVTVLIVVVPVLVFSALLVDKLVKAKEDSSYQYLTKAADDLALAFDQEVSSTVRTLQAMSMAAPLLRNDLKTFHGVISRALITQPSWTSIHLHNAKGKWLLDTRQPYGTILGPSIEPESLNAVVQNNKPAIGNVMEVPPISTHDRHGFAVRVPVHNIKGEIIYILSAIITTDSVQNLVNRFAIEPNEWTRNIVDPLGTLAARSRDPQKYIGIPAGEKLRKSIEKKESGLEMNGLTLDNIPVYTAFKRAPFSEWYSAIAVPRDTLDAEAASTQKQILIVGFFAVLLSMLSTFYFSKWLKNAIKDGANGAASLASGNTPHMRTASILEIEELRSSLLTASDLLRSREKSKSDFLANMSHELRTPLGIILGMTELISQNLISPDEQTKTWEIVKRNGAQLRRLIDDILDFSKIEADRLTIENLNFSLVEMIKTIFEDFASRAEEKEIQLKFIQDEGALNFVNTDPVRVRQILINLIGNAIKFTERGTVKVQLYKSEDNIIKITISDSGIGLSPQQQSKLFMEFTQGDSSHTRKYGGTGLGLSLSRKLANLLEGDVKLVKSKIGLGSIFEFTFKSNPISHELKKDTKPIKDVNPVTVLQKKILVVEDSSDNVVLIKNFLKNTGSEVSVASNGQQAINMAATQKFDLILMDIQMPVVDGFEATRKIRDSDRNVPIIAMTAHALTEHKVRALQEGFNAYLTKPLEHKDLLEVIQKYVG